MVGRLQAGLECHLSLITVWDRLVTEALHLLPPFVSLTELICSKLVTLIACNSTQLPGNLNLIHAQSQARAQHTDTHTHRKPQKSIHTPTCIAKRIFVTVSEVCFYFSLKSSCVNNLQNDGY